MIRKFTSALAGLILVIFVAGTEARQAPSFGSGAPVATRDAIAATPTAVNLLVGRSTVLDIGSSIARVSLTVPDVADAMVTAPTQLLIHGKSPGTISLFVWDRMGAIKTYEIVVRRDLSALVEQVRSLFPGESITVAGSGKDVILSGTVSGQYVIDKAADVAAGYVDKKENIVNLLKQQEGVASNQVMLKVRFAEVSRNALQELGASFFADDRNGRWTARTTTQQFAAPFFDQNHPSASLGENSIFTDFLNLFLFDRKTGLGAAVKALQAKGVFQSLAEPTLVAMNGKEASFLAGGEFPYPVPQGGFGSFSIHFKEYGVRLNFTPTVLGGDLVHLKLRPEVSSLDFNNAIVIEGFRIPALTSRRSETEVELRDGQTFAIAGLMNNTALSSMRKVPGIGDIPIIGHLFRSRAYQKDQTELVVMVTPHIVRRNSTGASEGLPALVEPYLGPNDKPLPNPAPYNGSPYTGQPRRAGGDAPVPAPAPVNAPAPSSVSRPVPSPMPSTPIQGTAQLPEAKPAQRSAGSNGNGSAAAAVAAPVPAPAAAPVTAPPAPAPMTKAEKKFIEEEKERQRKQAEAEEKQRLADEKRQAERDRIAAKKAEEDRRKAEKREKELAKKKAEADRKAAELARKKAEEQEKREKALAEAAERLKAAQAAYQAELAKGNKGGQ